jgi:hypothetical protein
MAKKVVKKTSDLYKLVVKGRKAAQAGGVWITGIFSSCIWQIKRFDEGSKYGIRGGKISKLWIKDKATGLVIADYERGWSIRPTRKLAKELFEILLKTYN